MQVSDDTGTRGYSVLDDITDTHICLCDTWDHAYTISHALEFMHRMDIAAKELGVRIGGR